MTSNVGAAVTTRTRAGVAIDVEGALPQASLRSNCDANGMQKVSG